MGASRTGTKQRDAVDLYLVPDGGKCKVQVG